MSYLALYRKYRPVSFDDMTGQKEVIEVIRREILSNKISHAYLFAGPRGTGKTSTAKIMARMVNCENLGNNGEPCGKCDACVNFNSNSDIVEIDAASNNGVDEIRELRDKVNLVPTNSRYKVYIIDEVHMLTNQAFNALLKTLEEPPSHAIFILATTEFFKIPVTVVSRCQKFQFSRVSNDEIVLRLRKISNLEGIDVGDNSLREIARLSDGGMRDAINMLDQLSSFSNNKILLDDVYRLSGTFSNDDLYSLVCYIFEQDFNNIISFTENINKNGKNISKFIEELLSYLRDVLYYKTTGKFYNLESDNIIKLSNLFSISKFYELMQLFNNMLSLIKNSSVPYVLLGVSLIQISRDINCNNIIEDKNELEKNIADVTGFKEKNVSEKNTDVELNASKIFSFTEKVRQVRINNTFSSASKDKLISMKEKWKMLDNYIFDDVYGSVAGLLKDVDILVVGDYNIMLLAKYDSLVERLYSYLDTIESLILKVVGKEYKVVFLANDEWLYEKNKYIENLKKGYKYNYIEDNNEVSNVNNFSDSNDDERIIVDIIGNDLIEYV